MHARMFKCHFSASNSQLRLYYHPSSKRCYHHQARHTMQAPARAALPQPLADLAEGSLSDITTITLTGGILASIGWSILPLLSGRAKERRREQMIGGEGEEEDEVVQWSVMGILSFVPFVNWTGWVFAALECDAPAGYYGLAALYALPWLKDGLQLDTFTVCCLLAGAVHVQIERIAATEPESVPTAGSGAIADAADVGRTLLTNSTKAFREVVNESALDRRRDVEEVTNKSKAVKLEEGNAELLQNEESQAAEQMRQWDERLSATKDTDPK